MLSIVSPRSWERLRHNTAEEQTVAARNTIIPQSRLDQRNSDQPSQVVQLQSQRVDVPTIPLRPLPILPPKLPAATDLGANPTFAFVADDDYEPADADSFGLQATTLISPELSSHLPTEPLPTPRECNLNTLLKVRDALAMLLDRAKQIELPAQPIKPVRSNVRVSSENDRLAELPDRKSSLDRQLDIQSDESQAALDDVPVPLPPVTQTGPLLRRRPKALINQLTQLAAQSGESRAAIWAADVLEKVSLLSDASTSFELDTSSLMADFEQLVSQAYSAPIETNGTARHEDWQRTAKALQRRLGVWRVLLVPVDVSSRPEIDLLEVEDSKLRDSLQEFHRLIEGSSQAAAWREYLLIDSISALANKDDRQSAETRRMISQQVLARMADSRLSAAQRQFLTTEPLRTLKLKLQSWATGPVDLQLLATLVELYERTGLNGYGRHIAQFGQRLRWTGNAQLVDLADNLDHQYRSANMRLALTDELLNRMMPRQEPIVSPVRDSVAGVDVRGRSRTTTELRVRLHPDPSAWRIDLEARGNVHSRTSTESGPARLRNAGNMRYEASKQIVINANGLQIGQANASAQGQNRLVDVETRFDPIPLLGPLMQNMAREKHRQTRPQTNAHIKSKVIRTAKQRMDRRADSKLHSLEQRFRDSVLTPLEALALVAEPVDFHTTEDRAVMRLRLAGANQLAAHTLRPLAPSDSLMSIQLHQSALNNALAGFGLDGRRMTLGELFDTLAKKLQRPNAQRPEDLATRAIVEFAAHDAIRVDCIGDRVEVILSIKELAHGRDKIRNFQAHAHFRPQVNGMQVTLVHDGTLQFSGRRLLTGPRVVLHSVFGKLLRKGQQVPLLADRVQADPRLEGLMVTQMVIDDGWIGIALGPERPDRVAWRAR